MLIKSSKYLLTPLLLILTGCGQNESTVVVPQIVTIDDELSSLIKTHNLSGDPIGTLSTPSITDTKAQLGMKLFFTKSLGGAQDSACVTCHHPALGGGDNLSLPIGIESIDSNQLGQGRTYDPSGKFYDMDMLLYLEMLHLLTI